MRERRSSSISDCSAPRRALPRLAQANTTKPRAAPAGVYSPRSSTWPAGMLTSRTPFLVSLSMKLSLSNCGPAAWEPADADGALRARDRAQGASAGRLSGALMQHATGNPQTPLRADSWQPGLASRAPGSRRRLRRGRPRVRFCGSGGGRCGWLVGSGELLWLVLGGCARQSAEAPGENADAGDESVELTPSKECSTAPQGSLKPKTIGSWLLCC